MDDKGRFFIQVKAGIASHGEYELSSKILKEIFGEDWILSTRMLFEHYSTIFPEGVNSQIVKVTPKVNQSFKVKGRGRRY